MKKIINNPSDFVDESIDGLIKSHPDIYALAKDNNKVITRTKKSPDEARVAIPFEIATTTTINIAGSNAVLSASTSS